MPSDLVSLRIDTKGTRYHHARSSIGVEFNLPEPLVNAGITSSKTYNVYTVRPTCHEEGRRKITSLDPLPKWWWHQTLNAEIPDLDGGKWSRGYMNLWKTIFRESGWFSLLIHTSKAATNLLRLDETGVSSSATEIGGSINPLLG